jgi:dihydroorotase
MTTLLLRQGRVIDPASGRDEVTNILIENGRIAGIGPEFTQADEILDVLGKIVTPGLIDLHAELREPGLEEDETIETGTAAALAGGFTSIAVMPSTDPPIDTQAGVNFISQKAASADNCNVFVIGCVSRNRAGVELAEMGSLAEAGAVAYSDADKAIANSELFRRALEYSGMFSRPILHHPEVIELSQGGIMHEGDISLVLGLKGMPAEAEDVMTSRDLRLAESTGGRLHLMNISTAGSVELIRLAKDRGVRVTAAVSPYHFSLNDDELRTFNPNCKLNPPLRSREHVDACQAGLADNAIDVIASSHSPRAPEKKMRELDQAPFGGSSLETTLPAVITYLVRPGKLTWLQALAKLTTGPASVLGIDKGQIAVGKEADITVIDPDFRWVVSGSRFRSKSGNTPYEGREFVGRADTVIVGGKLKYTAI